jgi:hypothetical protein
MHLPDFVDSWTSASLNQSNQLMIFVEGRMTNSPHRSKYTITVPLSEMKVHAYRATAASTNASFSWGTLRLPRSWIVEGWTTNAAIETDWKPAPIGPPITNTWELQLLTHAPTLKPLPGTERTLYPLIDARTNSAAWPSPLEFIYIDSTHPEAFTHVEAETVQVPVNNDAVPDPLHHPLVLRRRRSLLIRPNKSISLPSSHESCAAHTLGITKRKETVCTEPCGKSLHNPEGSAEGAPPHPEFSGRPLSTT